MHFPARLQWFDVHTHTQFDAFREDQDAVIRRALDQGVWLVNVGTQRDTSRVAVETAARYPEGVYATVGLHPIHTAQSHHDAQELGADDGGFTSRGETFDPAYYRELAANPRVVAIGECGLDYYRLSQDTRIKQRTVFEQQIALAQEVKKPLMIHCRSAFGDLIPLLGAYAPSRISPGIIHFFTGSVADAKVLLERGFSFSFGGVITFARDYDAAVRYIPLERIVLETDAPYVAPTPYRGKRNEPAYIQEVAKQLALIKALPLEQVASATAHNAQVIFQIPLP